MSRIADNNQMTASPWKTLYQPVAAEMDHVEEVLRREMRSDYPYVDELVQYGSLLGGKRLRPALLLLVAKAMGNTGPDHLVLAAVVEMIHTATLIHDDVLDGATLRRHVSTVNSRWDTDASVLLGDFLFTHAFYLASTLDSTQACQWIGRATNIVCEGEMRQKGSRGQFQLGEHEYFEILEAKTAELCACCCRLGAHFADASETRTEQMAEYGRCLGIAFQIADDLLDLAGDESTVGKSLGTDLQKQKPTLPVIHALQVADAAQRQEIMGVLSNPHPGDLKELCALLHDQDAFQYVREMAQQFAHQAGQQLEGLPDSPARKTLQHLTELVVQRWY